MGFLQVLGFAVVISQVAPVYNRIPGAAREGMNLTVTVRFENPTARPLPVVLERAYISFDSDKQGQELKEIALVDYKLCGAPPNSQCTRFTLPPGGKTDEVHLFSRSVAAEGHEDETVFVTLVFQAGDERVTARGAGQVLLVD